MSNTNTETQEFNPLPDNVVTHVQFVARSMIGNFGITESDYDDICQEMYLAIIKASKDYNPALSKYSTFTNCVTSRMKHNLSRKYSRRYMLSGQSVELWHCDEEDEENDDWSASCATPAFFEPISETPTPLQELMRKEREEFINSLPKAEKTICLLILEGYSLAKAIAMLRINRSSFYRQVLPSIAKKLKKVESL